MTLSRPARPAPWQALLVVGGALTLLFGLVPPFRGNGLLMNLLGLVPAVATVAGVRLHRPVHRAPWYWFAAGLFLFWFGDVYTIGYNRLVGGVPFPSIGDAAYIAVYPLLMVGLIALVRRRNPHRDRGGAIDALIISIGLALLPWMGQIAPYLHDPSMGPLATVVSVAYPIGDIILLAAVVRLAVDGGRREAAFHLLAAAIAALLVTDFVYGMMELGGTYHDQVWLDVGWIAFYLLWGAAALHPTMRSLEQPAPGHRPRLTRSRLALLSLASLVCPAVLTVREIGDGDIDLVGLGVACSLLFWLVVARVAGLVRLNERAVARERILSSAGAALVAANGREQMTEVALKAAARLAGPDAQVRLMLVGDDAAAAGAEAVRLPLTIRDETLGVLEVSGAGLAVPAVHEALSALVTQVAMALEGATLTEEVANRRSEARFASLVRHASDLITVVDRSGRIAYQSPSSERILGYTPDELVGRRFDELIDGGDGGRLARLLRRGAHGGEATLECTLGQRDGGARQFEVQFTDLLHDEHVQGIVLNARDISERKAFEHELAHQAFHDPVTNLANRALFAERVRHAVARSRRDRDLLAVLFLDLDDFKTVNDSLGHAAGDQVLLEVGRRLSQCVRASDTAARFGGDEFAVLLEDVDGERSAVETAERIIETLAIPFAVAQKELSLRCSVGIAVLDHEAAPDADELLRNADAAMYDAKREGKGAHRVFQPSMHEGVLARLELRGDLQRALAADELALHYQPIVRLSDGQTTGFEALMRWYHPERGVVAPDDFIPFAEETGLIVPMGRWALREGCRRAVALQAVAPGGLPLSMSVNLSVKQLQHSDVVADVRDALEESGLDPALLTLEITETVVMADTELAVVRLGELKALGVKLAMDDFGTGYSSLSSLSRFPVDVIKMDRSFLGPDAAEGEANMTSAVLAIGANLGLEVVAEGIERTAQWHALRDQGCQLGQGYLFAAPMDEHRAAAFLRSLDVQAPAAA